MLEEFLVKRGLGYDNYYDLVVFKFLKAVKQYETDLYELLENKYNDLLCRIEGGSWTDEDIEELKQALTEMKR